MVVAPKENGVACWGDRRTIFSVLAPRPAASGA